MEKIITVQAIAQMTKKEVEALKKAELLEIAKELAIVGRHDMIKSVLIESILTAINNNSDDNKEVTEAIETKAEESKKENNASMSKKSIEYATKVSNEEKRSQDDYINSMEIGMIIAFMVSEHKAVSAKVETIDYNGFDIQTGKGNVTKVYCKARNGIEYEVPRSAIVWVKTGPKWPKSIFNMLNGRRPDYKFEKKTIVQDKVEGESLPEIIDGIVSEEKECVVNNNILVSEATGGDLI